MPQARSGGSSGGGSSGSSSSGGSGPVAVDRQPVDGSRSGGSRSGTSRASGSRSSRSTAAKRPAAKRSTSARSGTTKAKPKPKPGSPEARVEAAATRVRKLNEQIIDAGKQAGESTLTSYEKFLKSIAELDRARPRLERRRVDREPRDRSGEVHPRRHGVADEGSAEDAEVATRPACARSAGSRPKSRRARRTCSRSGTCRARGPRRGRHVASSPAARWAPPPADRSGPRRACPGRAGGA